MEQKEKHPVFKILACEFEKTKVNNLNNSVYSTFWHIDRYPFDSVLCAQGFRQFDTSQDAPYFGVWVNPDMLCTVTYAEGDLSVVVCQDKEHYNAEIQGYIDFYEPGSICRVIGKSGCTDIQQDRTKFLIK